MMVAKEKLLFLKITYIVSSEFDLRIENWH
jgi:hypothetical protein